MRDESLETDSQQHPRQSLRASNSAGDSRAMLQLRGGGGGSHPMLGEESCSQLAARLNSSTFGTEQVCASTHSTHAGTGSRYIARHATTADMVVMPLLSIWETHIRLTRPLSLGLTSHGCRSKRTYTAGAVMSCPSRCVLAHCESLISCCMRRCSCLSMGRRWACPRSCRALATCRGLTRRWGTAMMRPWTAWTALATWGCFIPSSLTACPTTLTSIKQPHRCR